MKVFAGLVAFLLALPAAAAPATEQWIAVLTLTRPELHDTSKWTAPEQEIGRRHFAYWRQQTEAGRALLVGRTTDEAAPGTLAADTMGLVFFRAPNRAAATALIEADPGVAAGIWRYRLSGYRVALVSKDLAPTPAK